MKKKVKSFVQLLMEAYSNARPYIAAVLVIAISTSTAIKNDSWRIGVTASLAVTILFLIFDLFKGVTQRLDTIDKKLKEEEPPTYDNFTAALPIIKKTLEDRLIKNNDVSIRILGVSAQFSWKNLIELTLPDLFHIGRRKQKISVEVVIVDHEVLHDWGQSILSKESAHTKENLPIFKKKYKTEFAENKIDIKIWEYDNIPHWHGVLIDDDTLFMGRCKWQIKDDKYYYLQVGQKEYRYFAKNDRFKGQTRIELFEQWFDAYRFRSKKVYEQNSDQNKEAPPNS
ncbi:MAG: hypothetical protein V4721_06770 [Bacteroidota bacterium]